MNVTTALLCDSANVREGLLSVLSGGITRIWRPQFPSNLGVFIAVVVEVHQSEFGRPHEIQLVGLGQDGEQIFDIRGAFQRTSESDEGLDVGETVHVPVVLNLHQVQLPSEGPYLIDILIEGQHHQQLRFKAALRQPPSV